MRWWRAMTEPSPLPAEPFPNPENTTEWVEKFVAWGWQQQKLAAGVPALLARIEELEREDREFREDVETVMSALHARIEELEAALVLARSFLERSFDDGTELPIQRINAALGKA